MKPLLSLLLVLALSSGLQAYYCGNQIPPIINTPPPPVNPKASYAPDVDAASAFINAYKQALNLLYDLERSEAYGINYESTANKIQPILDCLSHAKSTTRGLIDEIDRNGYKAELLFRVTRFDYSRMIRQRGLNREIAEEVQCILNEGRIRDYLVDFCSHINEIQRQITRISQSLKARKIDISAAHRMSNCFAETLLRGDYISQMLEEALR